jgi:S1-C subfamily serine protease
MQDSSNLFEKALPSVFEISTSTGSGTGFLAREDGLVLTNAHVVHPEAVVEARGSTVEKVPCRVIKTNRGRDVAAIYLPPAASAAAGGPLPLSKVPASSLKVGQPIMTIGNPVNCCSFSCSNGYVAAKEFRPRPEARSFVQLDISVNWGNSGGPVLAGSGEVIAMATRLNYTPDGQRIEGVSFGIPSESLCRFVDSIPPLNGSLASKLYCAVCGNLVKKGPYCDHCGSQLMPRDFSTVGGDESEPCPACGHDNNGGVAYCARCGVSLVNNPNGG